MASRAFDACPTDEYQNLFESTGDRAEDYDELSQISQELIQCYVANIKVVFDWDGSPESCMSKALNASVDAYTDEKLKRIEEQDSDQ